MARGLLFFFFYSFRTTSLKHIHIYPAEKRNQAGLRERRYVPFSEIGSIIFFILVYLLTYKHVQTEQALEFKLKLNAY